MQAKGTCCYCGVGCGVLIASDGRRVVDVKGDPEHPANRGQLCSKGATLHLSAQADGRALSPLLGRAGRGRRQAGWPDALAQAADGFARIIRQHGPDAVAFYVSGQLLTEDYYVFNKLARALVGTNNIDTNSRLCMSSAVAGYKATLGADAPPACYADIDHADCILVAGSNVAFAHPVLYRRIEEARHHNPAQKLIVIDPRRTPTAAGADLHLQLLPGTDVALFHGLLHVLLDEGYADRAFIEAHTEGFAALEATVRRYPPAYVARVCGVAAHDIQQAARWFGQAGAALSLYCQGLNQSTSGTAKNGALINLHLATGHIGRPGAGPLSLTGQPNAMGGREVGAMATLLSAHRDLAHPAHRDEMARFWGINALSAQPGKPAVEMFEAVRRGAIKALWIACTNPAHSMPDSDRVQAALARAELVVVQDIYDDTETAAYADLFLPAAGWGEKEGTVTNSERCITHVRPAVAAPGEARPDWQIVVDFAHRLADRLGKPEARRLFDYQTAEQIFNEHRETTRGRDLDITGLSYDLLDRCGPQQWPYPEGATSGAARLYRDHRFVTQNGRARFYPASDQPVGEPVTSHYPLHLNTGRLRDQWHGMSRSGRVARLFMHAPEPWLDMHREDMLRQGLEEEEIVRVRSRRGHCLIRVRASEEVRAGQVFMPMHWGRQWMQGGGSNQLTLSAADPVSRQPELKHAAVRVEKVALPWSLVLITQVDVAARLRALRPFLQSFPYATLGLYGDAAPLLVFRAAAKAPAAPGLLLALDTLLGLADAGQIVQMADAAAGISKKALLAGEQVSSVRLAGETVAFAWLRDWMVADQPATAIRRYLLAPLDQLPEGRRRGRMVCTCLGVAEEEIRAVLAQAPGLTQLQAQLKCGTECGACLPELRQLARIASQPVEEAP
jgi:assimilatory nitrate reductase catalytic subunit